MKWGQEDFVPTNPDLVDILGDTDFDFENVIFAFFWIPNFQISRSQISKFPEIWPGPALGRAWATATASSGGAVVVAGLLKRSGNTNTISYHLVLHTP